MASSEQTGAMTNKLYESLKYVALLVLPALATLYFAVAQIWGLSHGAEVVATITAVDTFLGVVLKISSASYYSNGANFDGVLNVGAPTEEGRSVQLSLDQDHLSSVVDDPGKHSVEFQINKTGE